MSRVCIGLVSRRVGGVRRGLALRRRRPSDCRGRRSPLQPDRCCYGVGYVYLRKGDVHQALPWLERGLEVSRVWDLPVLFSIRLGPGLCYVLAGRVTDALPLLEQRSRQSDGDGQSRGLGPCLAERGVSGASAASTRRWSRRACPGVRPHAPATGNRPRPCGSWARSTRTATPQTSARPKPPTVRPWPWPSAGHAPAPGALPPWPRHCTPGPAREQARTALSAAIALYRAMDMTFWLPAERSGLM